MNAPPPPFQDPNSPQGYGQTPQGYGGPPQGYGGPPQGPPPGYAQSAPRVELMRRATLALILAYVPILGTILIAPLLFLGSGSSTFRPDHVWMYFKEGGWGMLAITGFQLLLAGVLLVLSIFMIRGKRVPGAVPFTLALGPYFFALLGALVSERKISGALEGGFIDPSQKGRIWAEGISETSNLFVYGGVAAGCASYAAALMATLSLFTIDPAPLGPPPKNAAWIFSLPAGVVAAIVAVVLRFALHVSFMGLDALIFFGLLHVGVLAGTSARVLPALVARHNDDEEAGRAWRLLLVAAFGFAAAMLFVDRAGLAASVRTGLGAVAGESVDPSQRATILASIAPQVSARGILMFTDALLCLLVFAAPLIASIKVKRKLSIPGVGAVVAAGIVAGVSLLTGSRFDRDIEAHAKPYEDMEKTIAAAKVDLPAIQDGSAAEMLARPASLLLTRDGTSIDPAAAAPSQATPSPPLDEDEELERNIPKALIVAADRALPFDQLVAKVGPKAGSKGIGLVARPAVPHDFSKLGPYAGLMGVDLWSFEVGLVTKLSAGLPPTPVSSRPWETSRAESTKALAILPSGDTAKLVILSRVLPGDPGLLLGQTLPLAEGDASERRRILADLHSARSGLGTIVLAPAATDTVGRVVTLLEMISAAQENPRDDVILTGDRAALELATTAAEGPRGRFSVHEVQVVGPIPAEVVTRILRTNAAPFGLCYSTAKATPSLGEVPSEIAVRFIIPPTGTVKLASAGPSRNLFFSKCIETSVKSVAFPSFDRGQANVTLKLQFN